MVGRCTTAATFGIRCRVLSVHSRNIPLFVLQTIEVCARMNSEPFYELVTCRHAEKGLQKVSEVGNSGPVIALNRLSLAYGKKCSLLIDSILSCDFKNIVSGLGFGIISGAFSLVNVLADAVGPGTVGLKGDSSKFFIVPALLHSFLPCRLRCRIPSRRVMYCK